MNDPGRATPYGGQTSFKVCMPQLSKYLRPKAGLHAPLPNRQLVCSGETMVQADPITNGLPLPSVPSCKDGRNPAADPSPGTLWTLRKVTGGVFK